MGWSVGYNLQTGSVNILQFFISTKATEYVEFTKVGSENFIFIESLSVETKITWFNLSFLDAVRLESFIKQFFFVNLLGNGIEAKVYPSTPKLDKKHAFGDESLDYDE